MTLSHRPNGGVKQEGKEMNEYMPILDDRRLDDELAEARRILNYYRLMFVSGNENPVRQRMIEANDIVVRDTQAFFERWKELSHE